MKPCQTSSFINESLVDAFIGYIESIDVRIAALRVQAELLQQPPAEKPGHTLEVLVGGACVDCLDEIRRWSNLTALKRFDVTPDVITELAYLMAAWADETLICALREHMPQRHIGAMEHALFGTMDAGEQIFTKIECILARRSDADTGLAAAYVIVLALGFRGQYFEPSSNATLAQYQSELAALAFVPDLPGIRADSGAAAQRVPIHPTVKYQKYIVLWVLTGVIWCVVMLGMNLAWYRATVPLKQSLVELKTAALMPRPLMFPRQE